MIGKIIKINNKIKFRQDFRAFYSVPSKMTFRSVMLRDDWIFVGCLNMYWSFAGLLSMHWLLADFLTCTSYSLCF